MARVEAGESFRDATSCFLEGVAKLVQVGMAGESGISNLRVLLTLSKALAVRLEEFKIPCCQQMRLSYTVSAILLRLIFCCYYYYYFYGGV